MEANALTHRARPDSASCANERGCHRAIGKLRSEMLTLQEVAVTATVSLVYNSSGQALPDLANRCIGLLPVDKSLCESDAALSMTLGINKRVRSLQVPR